MKVGILAEGGNMAPGPALAQKLGPMGINMGQVISKVNEATQGFKGMKVPVELDIDPSTKEFEITVKSPPISELLKKETGIEKGSGDHKKLQVANVSIEQIIKVAKTKLPDLLEKDLKAAVKSVVGSCVSLGILVESKSPVEVAQEVADGKYDKEIQSESTETPAEKKKELDSYFDVLNKEQSTKIQQEKAELEAKEEAEKEKAAKALEAAKNAPASTDTKKK